MHLFVSKKAASSTGKKRKSISTLRKLGLQNKITATSENVRQTDDCTPSSTPNAPAAANVPEADLPNAIYEALEAASFGTFLQSSEGGARKQRDSVRILKNTSRFLQWSYEQEMGKKLESTETMTWLSAVITKHYKHLFCYGTYMENVLGHGATTICNHMYDIVAACDWYAIFDDNAPNLPDNCIIRIRAVAGTVRKVQKKREKATRSRITMDSKIQRRRMPRGGLPELQQAVRNKLFWVADLKKGIADYRHVLDKDSYGAFMNLMYSALYVFSAQGRIAGLMDMTYQQGEDLLVEGFSTTDQFKTNQRWGLQPVTLSDETFELLTFYMAELRPQVSLISVPNPNDKLWLTHEGKPDNSVGGRVISFFRREIRLHITTTAIRSLVETTMDDLHESGVITHQQKASVQAINGHTSAVASDYYIHKARGADVAHARSAFALLGGPDGQLAPPLGSLTQENLQQTFEVSANELPTSAPPLSPLPLPVKWQARSKATALQFGTSHPDFDSPSMRAKWTEEEMNYITQWCDREMQRNPNTKNVIAKCLKFIMNDPLALPIFHPIHILDSSRLRNGYRAFKLKANKQVEQEMSDMYGR